MGWWERYDGTVIGDQLADVVGDHLSKLVNDLVKIYPSISRDQVLHTISFCSGYIRHFDEHRKIANSDKILAVMTIEQLRKWNTKHEVAPDMCKRIVPNTALVNVYNPFSGDVV